MADPLALLLPQRIARISALAQQKLRERQILAPRRGIPKWSSPKVSFALVHRSFGFQGGTGFEKRSNRSQPLGLAYRPIALLHAARQVQCRTPF